MVWVGVRKERSMWVWQDEHHHDDPSDGSKKDVVRGLFRVNNARATTTRLGLVRPCQVPYALLFCNAEVGCCCGLSGETGKPRCRCSLLASLPKEAVVLLVPWDLPPLSYATLLSCDLLPCGVPNARCISGQPPHATSSYGRGRASYTPYTKIALACISHSERTPCAALCHTPGRAPNHHHQPKLIFSSHLSPSLFSFATPGRVPNQLAQQKHDPQ